ncbi:protein SMAX1-LIKE 3-like [Prosopis cineraria]|uniref:protein SMAX1-LIKE 3-like n=1 Tax=Prosopis cineraria TaxID=364024 RepID=UPI00240F4F48|nr:protein SMAX1-LIKE 3-like [Prosopis cineraria]
MRTGNCAVHQGLTAEAAAIVKQAVTLAKRRGHAQVTPLHVANTMLASASGLLRSACLQSHSHPLQCKALELCFNVALNRLPASNTAGAMLGPTSLYSHCPSISNALVAAFKRAQAHQRRGSIENQQQPLLAVKIELEQLIISILDDPSVSRVMREAGFSSTQVKSNIEQTVSLEICSQKEQNTATKTSVPMDPVRSEDVSSVIGCLVNQRRRSTVVVGECEISLEGVVRGVMDRVEKDDAGEGMRGVKFVSLSRSAFGHLSKVEVESKIEELKSLVTNSRHCKGFILYVGDLKWLFEYKSRWSQQGNGCYCPVEHMIVEVGKLVSGENNNGGLRLMGIATFQTYMRCRNGHPSLATLWGLHPLTIPAGSLHLSLVTDTDSDLQNQSSNKKAEGNRTGWLLPEPGVEKQAAACLAEPSPKFELQVRSLQSSTCNSDSSPTLPAWLQQYKHESRASSNDQNCVPVGGRCKKWNSLCNSPIQKQTYHCEKAFTFSPVSPSSSPPGFSYNPPRDQPFWISESGNSNNKPNEPALRMYIPDHNSAKQSFPPSYPSSNPNSTSSSDLLETEYVSRFKGLTSENFNTLCNALEEKVPWQKDIVPDIVSTVLQCRSGMLRRKEKIRNIEVKKETWLFFQGVDVEAKEKIARELATKVFGSHSNNLVSIALSSFSSTGADSTEEYVRNKRSRDERSYYVERFGDAVSSNPHRVFLLEDIEQADYCSQLGFKRAIERGRIVDSNGKEISLCDAIIIFSCESFSSRSRPCSPPVKQKLLSEASEKKDDSIATVEETSPWVSLDLNISIDDDCEEDRLAGYMGLLESVDRRIVFKTRQEL